MPTLERSNIKTQHSDISLAQLADEFKDKRILVPSHQREYCWDEALQSNFVLSILRGYPIPSMLMSKERGQANPSIEDGRQRITTAMRFRDNLFAVEGKRYRDLTEIQRERFDDYKVLTITFSGATLEERIEIFDWFNSGKKLTSGEHCHNQASTPLVSLAKELFMTLGTGVHDRAVRIWGVRGEAPGSEEATKDKGRRWLINAVALCMGLLYGPENVNKNYKHIKKGYMTSPISPQRREGVLSDLNRILEIYEAVELQQPMGRKKLLNPQWDLGTFTGYIIYSLSVAARKRHELSQTTPFELIYQPNTLEGAPEEWERLKAGWVTYIVGVRRALIETPSKKLPTVLGECLYKGMGKDRNWKLKRWEQGYLRVFAPAEIIEVAEAATESGSTEDEDEEE